MLDFFSRSSKKQTDPLLNANSAKQWVGSMVEGHGASTHDLVTDLIRNFNETDVTHLNGDLLDAILTLNLETQAMHEQLCAQYLMNTRMPKVLEVQLRTQILAYGKQFLDAYQRFIAADFDGHNQRIYAALPLVLARVFYYYGEQARWQYYRHFTPDETFWSHVNKTFLAAESLGMDMTPVFLFDEQASGTTVQDQFLIVNMLAQLNAGNMSLRQMHFAYEVLRLLSNRLSWREEFSSDASFVVALGANRPAERCLVNLGNKSARYWNTAELVNVMYGWLASIDAGKAPSELRKLLEPGLDGALIRVLCREWAPRPVRVERAERVPVSDRNIEVAHRFAVLHGLVRRADPQQPTSRTADESFDDASDIRVYGFVTSRRKDRLSALAAPSELTSPLDVFANWSVENASQTGLGVSLNTAGSEWVGLGQLLGYRNSPTLEWSLGLIRRVKYLPRDKVFLGIETLTDRPVAAAIWQPDGRPLDLSLPPDLLWHQNGQIVLFAPIKRAGRNINAVILPLTTYTLGKSLYMSARGKHFLISLGKVLEKGSDWCMCEVELVQSLQKAPMAS
jgi:hypothetical protein